MKQLTWPAVTLLAVIGAVVVLLAAFTDWGSGEIIAVAGILAGIGGGAAVAGGVSGRVEDLHAETTAQTAKIDTVARRVNGELDARIAAAMEEAAETGGARVIAELRKQGVIK
jgi:hypothetical protein